MILKLQVLFSMLLHIFVFLLQHLGILGLLIKKLIFSWFITRNAHRFNVQTVLLINNIVSCSVQKNKWHGNIFYHILFILAKSWGTNFHKNIKCKKYYIGENESYSQIFSLSLWASAIVFCFYLLLFFLVWDNFNLSY